MYKNPKDFTKEEQVSLSEFVTLSMTKTKIPSGTFDSCSAVNQTFALS